MLALIRPMMPMLGLRFLTMFTYHRPCWREEATTHGVSNCSCSAFFVVAIDAFPVVLYPISLRLAHLLSVSLQPFPMSFSFAHLAPVLIPARSLSGLILRKLKQCLSRLALSTKLVSLRNAYLPTLVVPRKKAFW